MKTYILAAACFVATLAALSWLKLDNQSVAVATRNIEPGAVLQKSDVQTLVYNWRYRMPNGTIRCWFSCGDRAVGHTVVRHLEKYQTLTTHDIN